MIVRIKCPKCGSEDEKDFEILYIDDHLPDNKWEWREFDCGRCKNCKGEWLVWRKE